MLNIPQKWKWFHNDRYGLFIHWGPYSVYGRGEQIAFREHLDLLEYEKVACKWNPMEFDAKKWAKTAKNAGFKYACFTTKHHDGYCMWDTKFTDYSSASQAPKRDFVREYVDSFRAEGLKIGLYYSWMDWRLPIYFEGPEEDKEAWESYKQYMHGQVEELLSNYGKIDYFFFDGVWPRNAEDLGSLELVEKMRKLQPDILINDRLGYDKKLDENTDGGIGAGGAKNLGDFGTPERSVVADRVRMWESCQVSTWRLWGYTKGERFLDADKLLDVLCECTEKGGNLLLNVGPDRDGRFPDEFNERALKIGEWLRKHGEAIYGHGEGNLTEFVTHGYQTIKGNNMYLIFRFWDGEPTLRLADILTPVKNVTLLTTSEKLGFRQSGDVLYIDGLPSESPDELFPVIKIEFEGKPQTNQWGRERLWEGDPKRAAAWAKMRGTTTNALG